MANANIFHAIGVPVPSVFEKEIEQAILKEMKAMGLPPHVHLRHTQMNKQRQYQLEFLGEFQPAALHNLCCFMAGLLAGIDVKADWEANQYNSILKLVERLETRLDCQVLEIRQAMAVEPSCNALIVRCAEKGYDPGLCINNFYFAITTNPDFTAEDIEERHSPTSGVWSEWCLDGTIEPIYLKDC